MSLAVTPRVALRSHATVVLAPEAPPFVVRVDPADRASGVFRDALVVVSLSHAADATTVSSRTFRVEEAPGGSLPARLMLSPDGRVLIWRGRRLMTPGLEHRVVITGVRDLNGREVAGHCSRFVPCDLFWVDPSG